jgi:AraC-like DNA-binding protein
MVRLSEGGYPHRWRDCDVSYYEGDRSTMMDFHIHVYYEISLILTGNVRSMLSERVVESEQSRLVLTAPYTPHWMELASEGHYSRINLSFSREFLEDYVPEWRSLAKVFGKRGNILLLTREQRETCRERLVALDGERDPFRQRLKILELLSHVAELDRSETTGGGDPPPAYIVEALTYIGEHYGDRIVAQELAWRLGVGRTTLMTGFRRYTGSTLGEYLTRVRVKAAIPLLRQGISQERVAERVGLCSGGGLIRAFRHCYGVTPKQYMKEMRIENDG